MPSEPKVLRSFFVDQRVDQTISRLALEHAASKNELFRVLLQTGMRPFVEKPSSVDSLGVPPGSELDEREGSDKVLRSIFLDRKFDEFLRLTAFNLRCSKSELMRQFIDRGLQEGVVDWSNERLMRKAPRPESKLVAEVRRRFERVTGKVKSPVSAAARMVGPGQEDRLRVASLEDALTGIANRRHFEQALAGTLQAEVGSDIVLSVAVVDVDRLKSVNDRFGHSVGDQVLKTIGGLISAHVREIDLPARLGGDEFAVLFKGATREVAQDICGRIRSAVADFQWDSVAPGLQMSITIGISEVQAGDTAESILRRSGQAMYGGKSDVASRV